MKMKNSVTVVLMALSVITYILLSFVICLFDGQKWSIGFDICYIPFIYKTYKYKYKSPRKKKSYMYK